MKKLIQEIKYCFDNSINQDQINMIIATIIALIVAIIIKFIFSF